MNEFIEKISSYNIFNHFFPGILFVSFSRIITPYSFGQKDIITEIFVYYFIGLIISRFGSLVIEPILVKSTFIKFASYADFEIASKTDSKIEILSETSNMYRTLISMLFLLILLKGYSFFAVKFELLGKTSPYVLIILLFIMFLFSYKKQAGYITKKNNKRH